MGTHHFNSRPHGGRLPSPRKENFTNEISTHALTEGDHQPAATGSPVSYFNSRPHGGRLHWLFFFAHQAIFQLTPSRRATSARVSTDAVEVAFQLTPSRRATFVLQILLFSFPFQLTPSRRATKSGSVLVLQWEFQLTPSRRATSGFFSVALIVFNFNSRPHGGRRGRSEMPYDNAAFQLTPSRRATREHFCFPCRTAFQLTPSRRATIIEASAHRAEVISTHALTEGDRKKR